MTVHRVTRINLTRGVTSPPARLSRSLQARLTYRPQSRQLIVPSPARSPRERSQVKSERRGAAGGERVKDLLLPTRRRDAAAAASEQVPCWVKKWVTRSRTFHFWRRKDENRCRCRRRWFLLGAARCSLLLLLYGPIESKNKRASDWLCLLLGGYSMHHQCGSAKPAARTRSAEAAASVLTTHATSLSIRRSSGRRWNYTLALTPGAPRRNASTGMLLLISTFFVTHYVVLYMPILSYLLSALARSA